VGHKTCLTFWISDIFLASAKIRIPDHPASTPVSITNYAIPGN
jgi:hypothetical protein